MKTSIVFAAYLTVGSAYATTRMARESIPYTKRLQDFRPSLTLPTIDQDSQIPIPQDVLLERIQKSKKDQTIESVSLGIKQDQAFLNDLSGKLAQPGKQPALVQYLQQKFQAAKPIDKNSPWRRISLDDAALALIELPALSTFLAKNHRQVIVDGGWLHENPRFLDAFMHQIKPFIKGKDRKDILRQVSEKQAFAVDDYLLPDFAKRNVGRYLPYRGPNCFHAALAFQDAAIPKSVYVNVKEEEGYHRAMINYDELWRYISSSFYEVNPKTVDMQYGDLMVFFELDPRSNSNEVIYSQIRHATTYLFNQMTFSKGSKSPDTPYSVKSLPEEWQTWKKLTKNLGVKVFRKKAMTNPRKPVVDLVDWIY